jgi:E3 ubiquitin-protein ligase HERC4
MKIDVAGVTARSGPLVTPRGYETAIQVAAGANHACLVHQSGQLYTWGLGVGGRLGHGFGENANSREDCGAPTVVVGLMSKAVVKTACGHSHTMALTSRGAHLH